MANYLYNGVELPELPEWDKNTSPYAVITYEDGVYRLGTRIAPVKCSDDGDKTSLFQAYEDLFRVEGESWVRYGGGGSSVIGITTPIWSNHNVYNEAGRLVLAESIPILADSKLSVRVAPLMAYNGIALPPLPEVEGYQYAVVSYSAGGSETQGWKTASVSFFEEKPVRKLIDTAFGSTTIKISKLVYSGGRVLYSLANKAAMNNSSLSVDEKITEPWVWTFIEETVSAEEKQMGTSSIVWANFEVLDENDSVWLPTNTPVNCGTVANLFCSNLNSTDNVYRFAAWCYPKGTDFQTAPHTYTSPYNFYGPDENEDWVLVGLQSGVEYDLYACIMVDGLATDHNALVSFTAEGAAELPDFTNTSLYVSNFDCTETTADFEIGWRNLPFIEQPNAVVYYISAELDDGSKQIVELFSSDDQRGDGVHSFPTFEGLSPGTMYTMTARLLYSKTDDFSGYTDSGVYVTHDFTTLGKKDGYDRDSFLLGFASGLGCTAATKDGAEYNSWAQGYITGCALRKAL